MRRIARRRAVVVVPLVVGLAGGCASLRTNTTLCRAAWTAGGATLGGVGGGVGVNEIENGADDGEVAAGAVVGVIGGGVIGALIGYWTCPTPEPPPPPPAAVPPPPPPPSGTQIATIPGPHFAFDQAALTPEGRRRVSEAARILVDEPRVDVRVDGYTDAIGSDAYNLRLGERRARAVERALIEDGVAASRITVRSFGKANPIAPNDTPEGRARNRRVEIVVR